MTRSQDGMWFAWWSDKAAAAMSPEHLHNCRTDDGRTFQATSISTFDDAAFMALTCPQHDDIILLGEVYVEDADKKKMLKIQMVETDFPLDDEDKGY